MDLRRLLQVRAEQIAAVAEGDLQEGGPAAAGILAAADGVRAWSCGRGGAFFAPGGCCKPPCLAAPLILGFRVQGFSYPRCARLELRLQGALSSCHPGNPASARLCAGVSLVAWVHLHGLLPHSSWPSVQTLVNTRAAARSALLRGGSISGGAVARAMPLKP